MGALQFQERIVGLAVFALRLSRTICSDTVGFADEQKDGAIVSLGCLRGCARQKGKEEEKGISLHAPCSVTV